MSCHILKHYCFEKGSVYYCFKKNLSPIYFFLFLNSFFFLFNIIYSQSFLTTHVIHRCINCVVLYIISGDHLDKPFWAIYETTQIY